MRTAINISAAQAATLSVLHSYECLISINEPNEDPYPLQIYRGSESVLTVHLKDNADPITSEDQLQVVDNLCANNIVNFIHQNRNKDFIIHCAAGVSRSSAVALYINVIYGHKLKDNFFETSIPNRYVLQKLLETYQLMRENM